MSGTRAEFGSRILNILQESAKPLRAAEIVKQLGACGIDCSKSEVNSFLYTALNRETVVLHKEDKTWSSPAPGKAPAPRHETPKGKKRSSAPAPRPAAPERLRASDARTAHPTATVTARAAGALVEAATRLPVEPGTGRRRDLSQARVIEQPVEARQLVEAGPGYGKTEVSCARVAHLLDNGTPASSILLLSFTRTAVREMRERIVQLAHSLPEAGSVTIKTIDSFSWMLRRNFVSSGQSDSYEQAIANVAQALQGDDENSDALRAALEMYQHVLVDEAQDLYGVRAELIAGVLSILPEECGWTLFHDPAQAIYGWEDVLDGDEPQTNLVSLLEQYQLPHEKAALTHLHRTASHEHINLLLESRSIILDQDEPTPATRLRGRLFGEEEPVELGWKELVELVQKLPQDAFILFRTRAEALDASNALFMEEVPHRLRFGDLPGVVPPWIACIANSTATDRVTEEEFSLAWKAIKNPYLLDEWTPERAWKLLSRIGKSSQKSVSIEKIATAVARRLLPDEVLAREIGREGPCIGTIHGAKGREASAVIACVSPQGRKQEDEHLEGRILYVALSRARHSFKARTPVSNTWRSHERRWWRPVNQWHRFQIEIGKSQDVDIFGSVRGIHAAQAQTRLAKFAGDFENLRARPEKDGDSLWKHVLQTNDKVDVGQLAHWCTKHIWDIPQDRLNTPGNGMIKHLHWLDITTSATLEHPPFLVNHIRHPWRRTRLWLSPIVVSLGLGFLREDYKD